MRTATLLVAAIAFAAMAFLEPVSGATAVHHYDFNGSGVADLIGGANGTLYNGATVSGGVLNLDGVDDYVEFGSYLIPSLFAGSWPGLSVSVMARELEPTSGFGNIISQGYSYGPGFYISYGAPGRGIRIGDQWQSTGLTFPSDQRFHTYTVTSDPHVTSLYIDGQLAATGGVIGITTAGNFTRLGRQFQNWGEFFHGTIDEVWVFQGALTPSEVALLVPEPSVLSLLLAGGLLLLKRRAGRG